MRRGRATPLALIGCALIAAGAVYFTGSLGFAQDQTVKLALAAVAGMVIVYLAVTVDPAWLLSAGLVATMFAGHWDRLQLESAGPHRVLLIAGILAVLLRAPGAPDRPQIKLGAAHLVLVAALAYAVVSAIAAGTITRRTASFGLLDEFGVLPFLLFLVAPVAFATRRQRNILLGTLVAVGGYLAITAVLERLKLWNLVVPSYISDPALGTHFGRARGPFVEAGATGLARYACALGAAMALVLWRQPRARLCAGAVLMLAPVGVLLTVTRAVWLAAIVATAVVVITTPGLRRLLVPIAIAGTATVFIAFALIPGVARQAEDRQSDKSSVYERENTTAAGLRMIADRPLIGFGWDRGNDNIEPYFRLDPNIPLSGQRAGFHNRYLQYGVSLGLLGLGLWSLGLGLAVASALRRRASPSLRPWQVGLKGLLVAWVIVDLSSPASYSFATLLLWTWIGVAAAPVPQPRISPGRSNGSRPSGNGTSPAGRPEPAIV
jgi:O-antigen ligase